MVNLDLKMEAVCLLRNVGMYTYGVTTQKPNISTLTAVRTPNLIQ